MSDLKSYIGTPNVTMSYREWTGSKTDCDHEGCSTNTQTRFCQITIDNGNDIRIERTTTSRECDEYLRIVKEHKTK